MAVTSDDPAWRELSVLAAGGFATMTRLVEGEPAMYADICLTNREAILLQLDRFAAELAEFRAAIAAGDEGLKARFEELRARREAWLRERSGAAPAIPPEEFRGPGLFLPQRWQDALRGRRRRGNEP
jgi:hypothetical protein